MQINHQTLFSFFGGPRVGPNAQLFLFFFGKGSPKSEVPKTFQLLEYQTEYHLGSWSGRAGTLPRICVFLALMYLDTVGVVPIESLHLLSAEIGVTNFSFRKGCDKKSEYRVEQRIAKSMADKKHPNISIIANIIIIIMKLSS